MGQADELRQAIASKVLPKIRLLLRERNRLMIDAMYAEPRPHEPVDLVTPEIEAEVRFLLRTFGPIDLGDGTTISA